MKVAYFYISYRPFSADLMVSVVPDKVEAKREAIVDKSDILQK